MLEGPETLAPLEGDERQQLVKDTADALYAAKICSYAQGMNLLRATSAAEEWGLDLGEKLALR